MALGAALNFSSIDPIRALYWSAVLNGVVAVPVMITMMRQAMRPSVMAGFHFAAAAGSLGLGPGLVRSFSAALSASLPLASALSLKSCSFFCNS
jgi:hypothetical protein